ncbi:MAG: hypothetical protein CMO19_00290 [Thaumarchaeota archaeon]|nr:hypothetical protein [Nitrososphaerota archaeon]|tara:strand:+ start:152 stop:625 length:474 start_codon:yes stop_codon:yes gene_type:complete
MSKWTLLGIFILILLPGIDATSKEITSISVKVSNTNSQNNVVEISANLQNNNAEPISEQVLVFYINDQIFASKITNEIGSSNIQFQALDELYKVEIKFEGSEIYHESISEIVIIEKTNQENTSEQNIPSELLIIVSILTLGIVGSGILYYLNKISKN